jgi:putative pre-16S rRNA nuclease
VRTSIARADAKVKVRVRALGVDHGEKRIGIAISDETGTLAAPLTIIKHISRIEDARRVLDLAETHGAGVIVVGESTDESGLPNLAGVRATRFAELLKTTTQTPVIMWDESLSSQDARERRLAAGARRKKRRSPIDALAAAVMLQSYLDSARQQTAHSAVAH